jgi:endoglucanase
MLSPGDPTDERYLTAGLAADDMPEAFLALRDANPGWTGPQVFFAYIAQKYGSAGNILYEPANEPNGLGGQDERFEVWSAKLKPYFDSVISVIRMYDENGIVICGTDNWSQFVDAPANDPIDDPNVMYAMHFYSGTHDAGYEPDDEAPEIMGDYWLRKMTDAALDAGLAVFCSEWGVSTSSGDGGPYIDFAERWVKYMEDRGISWAAWSMAKKNEISAAFFSHTSDAPEGSWPADEVSVAGKFYRAMIRGEASPVYSDRSPVTGFDTGEFMFEPQADNPNADITVEAAEIAGLTLAKVSGVTPNDIWNNRIALQGIQSLFGIYLDLTFDVYLDASALTAEGPVFTSKPVFQYEPSWWYDAIPEVQLTAVDFTEGPEGSGLAKATVAMPLAPLAAAPAQAAEHLVLLIALGDGSAGLDVYIDEVAFATEFNGDVSKLPELPDEPGAFVKLPFDFESGTREGFAKEGDSRIDNKDLSVGMAESLALMFPASFAIDQNTWEAGVRIGSAHALSSGDYTADYWAGVTAITMDVYLEPGKAAHGVLELNFAPIPAGAGYWHQAGMQVIDPVSGGETVITPDGAELLKFTLSQPFTVTDYSEPVLPRNLVLALAGNACDYAGNIWYDNIAFE